MPDQLTLDGCVAVVTGAANGLGRAEALGLAAAGARVVLNDPDGNALDALATDIEAAGGVAAASAGDIGEWDTAQALLDTALTEFGQLDILVNNAGLLRDRMIFSMSPEEWDLVLRTHLRGHFLTSRIATAYWREASKQAAGPVCPAHEPDPLDPRYVAPPVTYLCSPAAARINGEVFVVHGGVAAVLAPPTVKTTFLATEHGSPDGMWTPDAIAGALAGFETGPSDAGFLCEDTLALASETIGYTGGQ